MLENLNIVNSIKDDAQIKRTGQTGAILNQLQIELQLEYRVRQGEALSDFFLVIPSDEEGRSEIQLNLTFPFWNRKLSAYYDDSTIIDEKREVVMKVFFCKSAPHAALCNHRLMEYPNISLPLPLKNTPGHIHKVYHV
jgi:hypothetical protein